MSAGLSTREEDYNSKDGRDKGIGEMCHASTVREICRESSCEPSGLVDYNFVFNENRADGGSDVSMAKFAQSDDETYDRLAEEIKKMGTDFLGYFRGSFVKNSWRYIADLVLYRNNEDLRNILRVLCRYGKSRRNGMFAYSVESDHVHVIHDCSFSGGYCRCIFRREIQPYGIIEQHRTTNKSIYKFTDTDWYDVFVYFFCRKRGERKIWIRGESGKIPSDAELLRWQEIYSAGRQMVRSESRGSDSVGERQSNDRDDRKTNNSFNNEIYGQKASKNGKFQYIRTKTKEILLKYYCSPISAIQDTDEFRSDLTLSDPKNNAQVSATFVDFGRDINKMSIGQIYNILKDKRPQFMTSMNYGDDESSLSIVDELIRFQCDDCDEKICYFLTMLVDILDKKLSKCNAISILSPPSAGKNFFFDMITAICLNYGQLGQANRHNLFAFQEAPSKRLLIWNEPNYESTLTDTLKMMFGGDPYTVRVKHSMDAHVQRTPVLILTNNTVPFLVDSAFKDRIVQFRWKAAPFLKNVNFKPYPMVFFELLNKYNIQF